MTSDRNYIFPTAVTIVSVMEHSNKDYIYDVNILCSPKNNGMDEGLFDQLKKRYPNFTYHYLPIDSESFATVNPATYLPIATFYRLQIIELLQQYERCIFLDGDLIVQCDVAEILNCNMGDNLLAAVRDIGMAVGKAPYFTNHPKKIGLPNLDTYVNAGVMVYNLSQLRKENIMPRLFEAVDRHFPLDDQDILNVVCYGRIFLLPFKYNTFNRVVNSELFFSSKLFSEEEKNDFSMGKGKIIHYASFRDKPWNNPNVFLGDIWTKYAQKLPKTLKWVKEEFNKIIIKEKAYDTNFIIKKCKLAKKIVLYGYSIYSQQIFDILTQHGIKSIQNFCDNNNAKYGLEYCGVRCEHPQSIVFDQETTVVICAQKNSDSIYYSLLSAGLNRENILLFKIKDIDYYAGIVEKAYDHEIEQIYYENKANIIDDLKEFKDNIKNYEYYTKYADLLKKYYPEVWLYKKRRPLISIIVPAYNAIDTIDRALQSIYDQDYQNWECIVIDDGSKDKTFDKLLWWQNKDERFKVFTQKNQGQGITRNRAISLARGEYLAFVDADDWVEYNYLSAMMQAVIRNAAEICKANFFFVDYQKGDQKLDAKVTDSQSLADVSTYISPNMWGNLFAAYLFKQNLIKMPAISMEDLAIYPLLLLVAKKFTSISVPVYNYHINVGKSVMDNVKNVHDIVSAFKYMFDEAKRLNIYYQNQELFIGILFYFLSGSWNGRVTQQCDTEEQQIFLQEFKNSLISTLGIFLDIKKIWIWGSYNLSKIVSCLPIFEEKYKLAGEFLEKYFGFSSIVSLMAETKNFHQPHLTDNIMRQDMLYKEFSKKFLTITPNEGDYLLLDLLEERHDILEFANGSLRTFNEIFSIYYTNQPRIGRFSAEMKKLWSKAIRKFIKIVKRKFNEENIIIVENYLSEYYLTLDNHHFPWYDVKACNKLLKQYYRVLEKLLPSAKVLKANTDFDYTDGKSRYGIDPSYKNIAYHRNMASKLLLSLVEK